MQVYVSTPHLPPRHLLSLRGGDNSSKRQSWCVWIVQKMGRQLIYQIMCHKNMPCSLLIWNYMQEVHFLITFASVIFYASPHMLLDIIKMFPLSLRNSKCRNSGKDYLIKVTLPKHSGSEESLSMKSSFK